MATSAGVEQHPDEEVPATGQTAMLHAQDILSTTEPNSTEGDQSAIATQPDTTQSDHQKGSDAGSDKEAGEIDESEVDEGESADGNTDQTDSGKTYFWCKCPCDPNQYAGVSHYYLHLQTSESRWEEPDEPYWLFDPATGRPDPTKLQQPKQKATSTSNEPPAEYQGYNPKIHGNYDPNAPYAKYHENKRKEEEVAEHRAKFGDAPMPGDNYSTAATFNRFTGAFQTADKSAEHHNDANKSYRQMHAYYDVDAAANTHGGQSLKAARQQQKFTKKEIADMKAKRKEKKMKKRLDWLKS